MASSSHVYTQPNKCPFRTVPKKNKFLEDGIERHGQIYGSKERRNIG